MTDMIKSMDAIYDECCRTQAKIDLFKRFLEAKASSILLKEFQKLVESHPEIKSIRWEQFTPYYNDGEDCVFRVGEMQLELHDEFLKANCSSLEDLEIYNDYESEDEDNSWYEGHQCVLEGNKELLNSFKEFVKCLRDLTLLRDVFGDHKRIILTKDETIVKEYKSHN